MSANKTRNPIVSAPQVGKSSSLRQIEELILKFLEYLEVEKGASRYTIRNYQFYLNRFSGWYALNYPNLDIEKLELEMVRKYRLFLSRLTYHQDLTLARVTQSYHIIALRSFLKWLVRNDSKVLSPEKIELPKTISRRLEFLNREQIERLLSQPAISTDIGLRDKAILEMLFSTGLRVSELTALNRDQVDWERGEFGVLGKGGVARVVFLSKRARQWIGRYLNNRDDKYKPLYIRYSGKKADLGLQGEQMRLTVRSVQRLVSRYAKKAQLPIKISPHGLRHSFATDLLHSGAGLREVQEMLGHKNVSTTQIYTHVTNPQLRKVHERYHSGNR